jgi:hypothetical protein
MPTALAESILLIARDAKLNVPKNRGPSLTRQRKMWAEEQVPA